jgi:mannose-1-phosphate guanylyltransferase/mannose-6-phosphate isomerase
VIDQLSNLYYQIESREMSIIPVILSGGSGTRLWPLSRESKPKQFLSFGGEHSLIQDTVLRCQGNLFDPKPILVCAESHRFLIAEDLRNIEVKADILLEPARRNSCAAIVAGCLSALARTPDAIVLVLAADHQIPDLQAFSNAVSAAQGDAEAGHLATFGIKPTKPATGYGYILPGKQLSSGGCFKIEKFVEKPDLVTAERYQNEGYLWNSGNFLFKAQAFIDELEKLAPKIFYAVSEAHEKAETDLDFLRLEKSAFERSPSISVDYAVMEQTEKAAVFPVDYAWSDVGSWEAVWEVSDKGNDENVIIGDAEIVDGSNNLVHSVGKLTTLVGVNDIAVVTTRDAVLVTSKSKAENVKELVINLQKTGRVEANEALQIFRPWGNYEQLDIGDKYQVKRIIISPGGILSLQKHRHRAEHWVVVSGTPEVTINEDMKILQPNQSVYIPLGSVHRLANPGVEPVVLIEVQTGDYLGEDDIIRLEDVYNRDSDS